MFPAAETRLIMVCHCLMLLLVIIIIVSIIVVDVFLGGQFALTLHCAAWSNAQRAF